jgi:hypothetical protein
LYIVKDQKPLAGEDDEVYIGKGEEAEFKSLIAIPKKGLLQINVGGEVA